MAATGDDRKGESPDVRGEARESAKRAGERVKAEGERLLNEVRGGARGILDQQQRTAADYLHDVSDAIAQARRTLDERGHGHTAGVLETAGDELDRLGARIGDRDAGSLLHEIEAFASRRPALFFAGALIAGFGAVRFLGSSRPERSAQIAPPPSAGNPSL